MEIIIVVLVIVAIEAIAAAAYITFKKRQYAAKRAAYINKIMENPHLFFDAHGVRYLVAFISRYKDPSKSTWGMFCEVDRRAIRKYILMNPDVPVMNIPTECRGGIYMIVRKTEIDKIF